MNIKILILYIFLVLLIFYIIQKSSNEGFTGLLNQRRIKLDKAVIHPEQNPPNINATLFIDGELRINNNKKDAIIEVGNNTFTENDIKQIISHPIPFEKMNAFNKPSKLCFESTRSDSSDIKCLDSSDIKVLNGTDDVLLKTSGSTKVRNSRVNNESSPYFVEDNNASGSYLQSIVVDSHSGVQARRSGYDGGCMPGGTSCNASCKYGHGYGTAGCGWFKCWHCPYGHPTNFHYDRNDAKDSKLEVTMARSDNIDNAKLKLVPGNRVSICM